MARVLITGGAGFVGSHLAESLLECGWEVTAVDDLSSGRRDNIADLIAHPRFRFALETIANEVVVDRLVSECDLIFHLAAAVGVELIVKSPIRVIETNVIGTHVVLKAAQRYHKKTIIASTSEIYGKSTNVPFGEDDDRVLGPTTRNRWSYATSKALDEFLALAYHKEYGLPVVICRFFNMIGPRQTGRYGMVVPRFVSQALAGSPITVFGDGSQSRCFCHVKDAVRAIMGLSLDASCEGEAFNIGSTEEITIYDLAQRVKERTSSHSKIKLVPYDQAYEYGFEDMQRRIPDISKIARRIGWAPQVTLDQTIDDIVRWFRSRPAWQPS